MAGLKVLFIGDIIGRLGRQALKDLVPELRKKHRLDLVVANIENLAHGKGVTKSTFAEVSDIGIDAFTGGNHTWKHQEVIELLKSDSHRLIRPANYPPGAPGRGYCLQTINQQRVLIINLIGRVFMRQQYDDPFRSFDDILAKNTDVDAVIVDFHAEATSEKKAFGWYADGRATLVAGTHTHVPTADAEILPNGLGYVTDVGMVGPRVSVLGVDKTEIIASFLTQLPVKHKMVEQGEVVFNSVLAEINGLRTIKMKRLDLMIEGR